MLIEKKLKLAHGFQTEWEEISFDDFCSEAAANAVTTEDVIVCVLQISLGRKWETENAEYRII